MLAIDPGLSTCCVGGLQIGEGMQTVRTVKLKMVFADGPKIAAARRDMLATLAAWCMRTSCPRSACSGCRSQNRLADSAAGTSN